MPTHSFPARTLKTSLLGSLTALGLVFAAIGGVEPAVAQERDDTATERPDVKGSAERPFRPAPRVRRATEESIELLLEIQEGPDRAEWPYEGVYRVRAEGPKEFVSRGAIIPIGYRVGGTGIVGRSLLEAPGYADDEKRQEALKRACAFVCSAIEDPLMSFDEYPSGYDVRGWGYIYGLRFLLALRAADAVPEGMADTVQSTCEWYLRGLAAAEIPTIGGWNYAGRRGASPFMTAPGIMVLSEAHRQGLEVETALVERAVVALERCVGPDGYVAYAAARQAGPNAGQIPGAIGRMVAAESALFLVGRSDATKLERAIEAFFEHWEALEVRRRKTGTHIPPYGVAPYYFFYAHYYCAVAIELLPERERPQYRRRLERTLFGIREADGSWNDRVFERSRNYGSALTLGALLRAGMPAEAPAWPNAFDLPPRVGDEPAPDAEGEPSENGASTGSRR